MHAVQPEACRSYTAQLLTLSGIWSIKIWCPIAKIIHTEIQCRKTLPMKFSVTKYCQWNSVSLNLSWMRTNWQSRVMGHDSLCKLMQATTDCHLVKDSRTPGRRRDQSPEIATPAWAALENDGRVAGWHWASPTAEKRVGGRDLQAAAHPVSQFSNSTEPWGAAAMLTDGTVNFAR